MDGWIPEKMHVAIRQSRGFPSLLNHMLDPIQPSNGHSNAAIGVVAIIGDIIV